MKTNIIIKDRLTDHLVQQQLVDIFCDGLTFDYLRMKILRENPRDLQLESTIQVAMHKQNLRQRIAIRGSNMTNTVQNDDNRQTFQGLTLCASLKRTIGKLDRKKLGPLIIPETVGYSSVRKWAIGSVLSAK